MTIKDLKEKWLAFYQDNQEWIKLLKSNNQVNIIEGGKGTWTKRPSDSLILGLMIVLEPKIGYFFRPMLNLYDNLYGKNRDGCLFTIMIALGFDFVPDIYLKDHPVQSPKQIQKDLPELDKLKKNLKKHWLIIYKNNSDWLTKIVDIKLWTSGTKSHATSKYLDVQFMLGVAVALEPQLKEYFIPLLKLNPSGEKVLEILDFYFYEGDENQEIIEEVAQLEDTSKNELICANPPNEAFQEELRRINEQLQQL